MIFGWIAIILTIMALWGHWAPGVMSLAGWLMSLGALALSVFSVPEAGKTFFNVTLTLTLFGIFLLNWQLGLWDYTTAKINAGIPFYIVTVLVVAVCILIANERDPNQR